MASANKIGIKQAPLDKRFTARCVVRDVRLKYTSRGKPYLELEVGDFSGRLKARLWEKFEKWQQRLVPGTILEMECTPYILGDRRELKVHALKMQKAMSADDYLEFLPRYSGNLEHLIQTFENYSATMRCDGGFIRCRLENCGTMCIWAACCTMWLVCCSWPKVW